MLPIALGVGSSSLYGNQFECSRHCERSNRFVTRLLQINTTINRDPSLAAPINPLVFQRDEQDPRRVPLTDPPGGLTLATMSASCGGFVTITVKQQV